jgi:hypothetical protein
VSGVCVVYAFLLHRLSYSLMLYYVQLLSVLSVDVSVSGVCRVCVLAS